MGCSGRKKHRISAMTSPLEVLFAFSLLQCILRVVAGISSEEIANFTQTFEDMLKIYDKRLRPNFSGEPCRIEIDITIASFDDVSGVSMDYTITMYMNQHWKDERLSFSNKDEMLTLPGDFAENIWVPDTYFANDKKSQMHSVTMPNKMLRIHGNGAITYGMRFTSRLQCQMDLHNYPLDTQNCTIEIKSYAYTTIDVDLVWRSIPVVGFDDILLQQFYIVGYDTRSSTDNLTTGEYKRLTVVFSLSRKIKYFIFQTYLPSSLIVMLSWVSFWINHEATPARVALGIMTVLNITIITSGVRSSLPRIPNVKAIDIYLLMCFVFVFASLCEYAAVNYIIRMQKAVKKLKKLKNKDLFNIIAATESVIVENSTQKSQRFNSRRFQNIRKLLNTLHNCRCLQTNKTYGFESSPPPKIPDFIPAKLSYREQLTLAFQKRINNLKEKIPKLKDVNEIDRYSRIIFPISFLTCNIVYWSYYNFY